MLEGRKQPRISRRFLAQIVSVDNPRQEELVSIKNVSLLGAQVAAVRAWATGSPVVIKFISAELRAKRARVVYCQAVRDKEFAVGLEFLNSWP